MLKHLHHLKKNKVAFTIKEFITYYASKYNCLHMVKDDDIKILEEQNFDLKNFTHLTNHKLNDMKISLSGLILVRMINDGEYEKLHGIMPRELAHPCKEQRTIYYNLRYDELYCTRWSKSLIDLHFHINLNFSIKNFYNIQTGVHYKGNVPDDLLLEINCSCFLCGQFTRNYDDISNMSMACIFPGPNKGKENQSFIPLCNKNTEGYISCYDAFTQFKATLITAGYSDQAKAYLLATNEVDPVLYKRNGESVNLTLVLKNGRTICPDMHLLKNHTAACFLFNSRFANIFSNKPQYYQIKLISNELTEDNLKSIPTVNVNRALEFIIDQFNNYNQFDMDYYETNNIICEDFLDEEDME